MIVLEMSNNVVTEVMVCDVCGEEIPKDHNYVSQDSKHHYCLRCIMQNNYMERRDIYVSEEDV